MKAEPVGESHEDSRIESPLYRVNFWQKPAPEYGWNLDAWVLKGCIDVKEALEWADRNANGRRFELLVTPASDAETDQLVSLYGDNPNVGDGAYEHHWSLVPTDPAI